MLGFAFFFKPPHSFPFPYQIANEDEVSTLVTPKDKPLINWERKKNGDLEKKVQDI